MIRSLFELRKGLLLSIVFFFCIILTGTIKIFQQSLKHQKIRKNDSQNRVLLEKYLLHGQKAPSDRAIDILNNEKKRII